MAVAFAWACFKSRTHGDHAGRSSAYNLRGVFRCQRTGERFFFGDRDPPEHSVVLLPKDAPSRFFDPEVLWNAVEAAERRKDSQVARELILALPANAEVTREDRIALARSFADKYFVSKGLGVQLDLHTPSADEDQNCETANWHAHLLITTRRITEDGLHRLKARDLDPIVRRAGGRSQVVDGEVWGEVWRAHQDEYFRSQGLEVRVDPNGVIGQEHLGPHRFRHLGAECAARAEAVRRAGMEAARDPELIMAALTKSNATFTARDLQRFLDKQHGRTLASGDIAKLRASVLKDAVALFDRKTGEACGRFTTREIRDQENAAMATAATLDKRLGVGAPAPTAKKVAQAWGLRPDQLDAFTYAVGCGDLKIIQGRAGTGKSYLLSSIREAHERAGKRVVGLAPTHSVVQDMRADGFSEASTVHSALFKLKNGRLEWDCDTIVMVDEAAMMGAGVTGELLIAARDAGAKLILVGDDRQLASIERGGLFTQLVERFGSRNITQVTRQDVDWQRQAAEDLAEYRFEDALSAFERAGAITWTDNKEDARRALVEAWARDSKAHPAERRFVFAYENRYVDMINDDLHDVRRARGELVGEDVPFETTRPGSNGTKESRIEHFAVGDRVQFTANSKSPPKFIPGAGGRAKVMTEKESPRIYNGNVGTITSIDAATGEICARLDAPGRLGPVVAWNANTFSDFRHGYAGTIYKGQGKTFAQTYLFHTERWQAGPSYVALTRQRKDAKLFVARDTAADIPTLARQMSQDGVRKASLAWATREDLATSGLSASTLPPLPDASAPLASRKRKRDDRSALAEIDPNVAAARDRIRRLATARRLDAVSDALRPAQGPPEGEVTMTGPAGATRDKAAASGPPAAVGKASRPDEQSRPDRKRKWESGSDLVELQSEVAAGKARFQRDHEDRRDRKAAAERNLQAHRLVRDWDRLIAQYRAALSGSGENATDPQPRARLLGFAERLAGQTELKAWLRKSAETFGLAERPLLLRLLESAKPEHELCALLAERAELQDSPQKVQPPQNTRLDLHRSRRPGRLR